MLLNSNTRGKLIAKGHTASEGCLLIRDLREIPSQTPNIVLSQALRVNYNFLAVHFSPSQITLASICGKDGRPEERRWES